MRLSAEVDLHAVEMTRDGLSRGAAGLEALLHGALVRSELYEGLGCVRVAVLGDTFIINSTAHCSQLPWPASGPLLRLVLTSLQFQQVGVLSNRQVHSTPLLEVDTE